MRCAAVVLACLALGAPAASAQTRLRPPVEIGLDGATGAEGSEGWTSLSPRLAANLTNRTALEVTFAPERDRDAFSHVDYLSVHLRRALLSRDHVSLFGSLGMSQATRYFDRQIETPFPAIYDPDRTWGPTLGFAAELPVAPVLRVRADVQYVMSQEPLLRFGGGVTVPIGRYPSPPSAAERAVLTGTPAATVELGQTIWVTSSDGRQLQGEVVSRSADGITISHRAGVTAFATSQIARVDATDRLGNGVLVGAGVGAAVGGAVGIMLSRVVCEGTDACVLMGALLIGGLGGGIGTLTGAVVDSFRDSPRPVYERPFSNGASLRLAPLVTPRRLGAGGAITW